ncbi:Dyp-type peroxidase [Sphingomonas sp. TDK1]|uniref:Dyp-type peroxidase n=1 Tax=Sphingomonas sp. TDK1 TaxID=453247 RepID=UPI0007DA464C|nr:hypothetical protein [Sphingomonas sp. TDK1]OAN67121.1 hypothetical protein A7X12_00365 [Sphingomonas sp. TDK1]
MTEATADTTIVDRADIQGIILSGYNHLPHAAYLFLSFGNAKGARRWLGALLPSISTGARWSRSKAGGLEKPGEAVFLAISFPGFEALELPETTLNSFVPPFTLGAAARADILGDVGESAPQHWEIGGPDNPVVHALLIAHAHSAKAVHLLEAKLTALIEDSDGAVSLVAAEHGYRRREAKEHFGFHDGLSQPYVDGVGAPKRDGQLPVDTGEFIFGYRNAYGLYPVSPVVPLRDDPHDILPPFPEGALPECHDFGRHGSYLVYRKLEQDVAGFWKLIEAQAEAEAPQMLQLAAKCLGRWPSGQPITLSPERDPFDYTDNNDFDFMPFDPDGLRCPIGSHIRRANPRDALANDTPLDSLRTSSRHRLIRRATIYGAPLVTAGQTEWPHAPKGVEDDGKPRGLQFLGINADIARQFEFLQQSWCNEPTFNAQFATKDPMIGDNAGQGYMTLQATPFRRRIPHMPRFVETRGSVYLFLPSITTLRYLAGR